MSENEDLEVKKLIDKMLKELISKRAKAKTSLEKAMMRLTDENFEKALKENDVIVVDFWAEWCMPCRFYEPIFEKVARKFGGKAIFARLNVDESPLTAGRLGISAIPTTIIFVKGKPVKRIVGLVDEQMLTKAVKDVLGNL